MTAVDVRQRCPEHDMPDCSPLLNGCTWRPLSPYELTRQQYAAQLVDDVADVLLAYTLGADVSSQQPSAYFGGMAAAVVRLVYPTLAEVKARDTEPQLHTQAQSIIAGHDGDAVRACASLLRDLRRLYDDAQNVREQYGESCRRAYDERDQAQRDAADAVDAVRRVKRTLRPITSSTDCDGLLAAVHAAKRIVRHVRVGREP